MFDKEKYRKNREAGRRGQEIVMSAPVTVTKWERRNGDIVTVQPSNGSNRDMFRKGTPHSTKIAPSSREQWKNNKATIAERVAKQEKVAHKKALERRARREAEKLGAAK